MSSTYVNKAIIKLAIKINSSKVIYICITSPLREGKKKYLCIPDRGKQPPPFMVLSGYHLISTILYHIPVYSSIPNYKFLIYSANTSAICLQALSDICKPSGILSGLKGSSSGSSWKFTGSMPSLLQTSTNARWKS